jgi:hypothetical protein
MMTPRRIGSWAVVFGLVALLSDAMFAHSSPVTTPGLGMDQARKADSVTSIFTLAPGQHICGGSSSR